jgi:hypothetical protein
MTGISREESVLLSSGEHYTPEQGTDWERIETGRKKKMATLRAVIKRPKSLIVELKNFAECFSISRH